MITRSYIIKFSTYLSFNGNCEDAFSFYQECLGGRIVSMMRWQDMPEQDGCQESMSEEISDKIMHACLVAGDHTLMGTDSPPNCPYEGIKGTNVAVHVDTPEEARGLFDALSENGTVTMPLEESFWAQSFGMFTDQFGVPWMINCDKEQQE